MFTGKSRKARYSAVFHLFRLWRDIGDVCLCPGRFNVQCGDTVQSAGFHQVAAAAKVSVHYQAGMLHPCLIGHLYQIVYPLLRMALAADNGKGILGYIVVAFVHQLAATAVNDYRWKSLVGAVKFQYRGEGGGMIRGNLHVLQQNDIHGYSQKVVGIAADGLVLDAYLFFVKHQVSPIKPSGTFSQS